MEDLLRTLLEQAVMDGIIDLKCTACGSIVRCEPDAQDAYCFDCGKVVPANNPLIKMGLI
jgi:hypothetical protein